MLYPGIDFHVLEYLAYHDDPKQTYNICIAAGPALVLAACESHEIDPIEGKYPMYESYEDIALFAGFFSQPLAQIWKLRNIPAPPEDSAHLASILETVPGGLDSCTPLPPAYSISKLTSICAARQAMPWVAGVAALDLCQ